MVISESSKILINLLAEVSNKTQHFYESKNHFQNGSRNKVSKCIQAKILDKNEILNCFNVMFFHKVISLVCKVY